MRVDEKEKKVASKPIPDHNFRRFKYKLEEYSYDLSERNVTLFSLGIATGYRLQDLVGLTVGEIREALECGEFLIQEQKQYKAWQTYMQKNPGAKRKPPRARKAGIGKNLESILEDYIAGRRKSEYAFRSHKSNKPITTQAFSRILTNVGKELGMKNISGHSMRKTYARRLYDKYRDIERVRQRLGHESIETTKRYLSLYEETLEEDANAVDNLL